MPLAHALRRPPIALLALIHLLGVLGAPFAAKLHVFQPGASAHQDFHVVWEACKYAAASLLALLVVVGPLAEGARWALRGMTAATVLLFGGVFFSDALTHGAPAIDHWAYGSFLVLSLGALFALWRQEAKSAAEAGGAEAVLPGARAR